MFNNPYFYGTPNLGTTSAFSGISSFFKNINWSNMLTNTSKTLGVINQAIPIVYQIKPIMNNAKTMFKIAGAITNNDNDNRTEYNNNSNNGPIFYI